jgi:hypothetical protein
VVESEGRPFDRPPGLLRLLQSGFGLRLSLWTVEHELVTVLHAIAGIEGIIAAGERRVFEIRAQVASARLGLQFPGGTDEQLLCGSVRAIIQERDP